MFFPLLEKHTIQFQIALTKRIHGLQYQGTSSYSTLISGILMFMITYASPMLFLISMTMHMAAVDINIVNKNPPSVDDLLKPLLGFPCLVPLTLNSIMLASYTVILLLMRNHLFVWSVFSPK